MPTIHTTLSAGKRPSFAVMGRRVYVQDGWRRMLVCDGMGNAVTAGIEGPGQEASTWTPSPTTGSGSPGITAGVHLVRYRYLNSQTGYVSEPSNEYTHIAIGSQYAEFSINTATATNIIRSSDAKADRIVVEMTAAGEGTVFYKAAEALMSASVVRVDISDSTLVGRGLLWGSATLAHNLPPVAQHVLYHRGRLWTFGQIVHSSGTVAVTNGSATVTGTGSDFSPDAITPDVDGLQRAPRMFQVAGDTRAYEIATRDSGTQLTLKDNYAGTTASGRSYKVFSRDNFIYVSRPGFPESWPVTNYIVGPEQGRVRGCMGLLNGLLIFSLTTTEYFNWTEDPVLDGAKKVASQERGAVGQRVLLNVEERVYGLDRRGFWVFEGVAPEATSRPIETIVARINWAVEETFHASFLPRLRSIRWWVALDGDTTPHHYVQLDVDRRTWTMGEREVAVEASALVPAADGTKTLAGDENGHNWFDDEGQTDGADSTPRATVDAGASTTVVPIQAGVTLPTAGTGLSGVVAHFERLNESRVIASNTASQLTLASALSSAPLYDDVIHLGRIKAKLKTRGFVLGQAFQKHRGLYVHVWFVPLASRRYARLRVYRDYSATAMTWGGGGFARRTQEPPRGTVFPTVGSTDWKIDLSDPAGVVKIGLGDEAVRVTEVELEFLESDTPAEILAVAVDGLELEALE